MLQKFNYKHNREIPLPDNTVINGQGCGEVANMKYGLCHMSYNGCEMIALHNSMVFMFLSFLSIMNYRLTKDKLNFIREKIKEKKETGTAVVSDDEKKSLEKIAGLKFEDMWIGQ